MIFVYETNIIYGDELRANNLIYIGMAVFIFLIGYRSLLQPKVVLIEPDEMAEKKLKDKSIPYKKSGLNEQYASEAVNRLSNTMINDKPYLKNDLMLSDLASMLNLSTHNLYEITNKKLGKKIL